MALFTEMADIPTAAVEAYTQASAERGLAVAKIARDGTDVGCC